MADDDDDDVVVAASCALIVCYCGVAATSQSRRRHSVWVKHYLRQRERLGYYSTLLPELRECDKVKLTNFIRMDWSKFNELLSLVEPLITKKRTKFRSVNFVYYLTYGAQI